MGSVGKNVIFLLIIWSSIFLVSEIAVRVYDAIETDATSPTAQTFNRVSLFVPHPFMAYAANPEHANHNRQGYRVSDRTRVFGVDSSAFTIACLGGSSTYGTRVPAADSYPHQLELALAASRDPDDVAVEVINAGLGGYSTANLVSLLALRVVHLNPDVAIFYVGFNDVWNRLIYSGFRADYSHAQKSWELPTRGFWRRSRLLDKLAREFGFPFDRNPHIHSVAWHPESGTPEANWASSTAEPFRANLETLVGIARNHDIVPVFVTQATDFEHHPFATDNDLWARAMEEYTDIIRSVARESSVDVIDVRGAMSNRPEFFADVLHMNALGNKTRAGIIASYLTAAGYIDD